MNTSQILVKILEESGVKHIFGHPGEQILPFYQALKSSNIKHILCRNEQGAAMAADSYARSSGNFGVCVATAGPGALNMTMGIATSFKDSVPLLVLTGDVPTQVKGKDSFQDVEIAKIFKEIAIKSFNPKNGEIAILNLKEAIHILENEPRGPIHLNLPKDILLDEDIEKIVNKLANKKIIYESNFDYSNFNSNSTSSSASTFASNSNFNDNIEIATLKIKSSKRPLIIAGAGIKWGKAEKGLKELIDKYNIPIATTYHSKGIINETNEYKDQNRKKLNLGMVGIRGTPIANYALENSDLILVLGAKLSERTISPEQNLIADIIHVNIDKNVLKGNINIHGNVNEFINILNNENSFNFDYNPFDWINEIYSSFNSNYNNFNSNSNFNSIGATNSNANSNNNYNNSNNSNNINNINYNYNNYNNFDYIDENDSFEFLKPQIAIKSILDNHQKDIVVNDAGSHTTWTTLFSNPEDGGQLLFSGAMAPMGYGLPGAIGASIANPEKQVIVIVGDGGIQMNIQELATIAEYNLPIAIYLLNNSQLGIIRQWEQLFYDMDNYEVDLKNPDFIAIAKAYNINSKKVKIKKELDLAIEIAKNKKIKNKNSKKPFLIEIEVSKEDIPLPDSFNIG